MLSIQTGLKFCPLVEELKAFADDKVNVTKKLKMLFGSLENIGGKVKSASFGYQCLAASAFSNRGQNKQPKRFLLTLYYTV